MLLTDVEYAILEFERIPWRNAGPKESRISADIGITSARYYQTLNCLIDDERGIAYDPVLMRRLRHARARRHFDRKPTRT